MSESLQARLVTDTSYNEQQQSYIRSRHISNPKFQRVNEVFKFSPTHSRQINVPEISYQNSSRSKYKTDLSYLDQLNSIFKHRKIVENKRPFFEENLSYEHKQTRSKSKINEDIEHSIVYINNLKKKRVYTESKQEVINSLPKINKNHKESVIEAIGLELPELESKRDYHSRFVTEPAISQVKKKQNKKMEQQGLFSYLQRDFIDKKVQTLTETKLVNYAKNPHDKNFHRIMLEKSRKFIKNSVENNFRQVGKIGAILNEESKKIIQQEIQQKKKKYERDYFVRNNVPYFSFLTLKQKQKQSVLKSIRRKKSLS